MKDFRVGDLVQAEGRIKNLRFITKEKAIVELENNNKCLIIEFQNGKGKRRADHVRRLMLKKGDPVIIIGKENNDNPLFLYGFDIKPEGMVSASDNALIMGRVEHIIKAGNIYVSVVSFEDKRIFIEIDKDIKNKIEEGNKAWFFCYVDMVKKCNNLCNRWNILTCEKCKKGKEPRYTATFGSAII